MQLLAGVVAAAVISAIFFLLPQLRRRRAASPLPPGPGGLPVVGHLPFLDPDLHSYFASLAATYGPIFSLRLGRKLAVVVSSPELAREVLREKDAVFANHDVPEAARVLTYGGADIVWTPAGPLWRMLRRVCVQEMLTPAGLTALYSLRRREVRAAVGELCKRAGTVVDLRTLLFVSVGNLMTNMLWGSTAEAAAAPPELFRELVTGAVDLMGQPNVSDFFPAVAALDLQGIRKKIEAHKKQLDELLDKIIRQRRGSPAPEKPRDFLDYLLAMEAEGGDGRTPFTMDNVKALLMDIIVGGSDSTAATLEWAMAEVICRPAAMRKLQEELDEVVGKERVVEEADTPRLPYLAATIKETLRLHPPVPLSVPHQPSADATVGGYSVPEGSSVYLNLWAIHRDLKLWEQPLEFLPERFLSGDGAGRAEFEYMPFGAGRRVCMGVALAERSLALTLATLLHSFDWRIPESAPALELKEKFGLVLRKATALSAIPTPRLSGEHLYQ